MTTPGSQAGAQAARSTLAGELRAAADFIEASGMHDRVHVTCRAGHVSISVWEPYEDAAARQAVVTRLAGLIGGTVRRQDEREFPSADLRAVGAVGGVPAMVSTNLAVRRNGPPEEPGRPFAVTPGGRAETVPGRLPDGWRWVTTLDPDPRQAAPREQAGAAPAPAAASGPVLAARDCPPLTGAALRTAAHHEQGAAAHPAGPGREPRPAHGRGGEARG
jgi:hypothetical protein